MTLANIDDNGLAQQSVLDSFLAISRLYLQGAERLSALNAAALRGMVADGATAMKALMGATSAAEGMEIQASMSNAMVGKVVAYTRGLHELAAETQEEMSRQTLTPTSDASGIAEVPDSWQDAVEAVTKNQRLFAAFVRSTAGTKRAMAN